MCNGGCVRPTEGDPREADRRPQANPITSVIRGSTHSIPSKESRNGIQNPSKPHGRDPLTLTLGTVTLILGTVTFILVGALGAKRNVGHMSAVKTGGSGKVSALCH